MQPVRHLPAPRAGRSPRPWLALAGLVAALPALLALGLALRFWSTASRFGSYRPVQPTRLYAAPLALRRGAAVDRAGLADDLALLGYRTVSGTPRPGEVTWRGDTLLLTLPVSPTPAGAADAAGNAFAGATLAARLAGGRVAELRAGDRDLGDQAVTLGRPLLYSYYDAGLRECRPLKLDQLPPHVVGAVLAAEDAHFFQHPGVAPLGILRAAAVNLRAGRVEQGGSTITQQLAWNLFLSHERTVQRKAREAALAILLDGRYGKDRILEAYLNEIYWGSADGTNLHGIGAAARAYFGKEPRDLTLAEAATLAGMIPSPGDYSPLTAPAAARQRRDWVLGRMAARGLASRQAIDAARAEPLVAHPLPLAGRRAPWFALAMAAEARQRFGLERLGGAGYTLLSTLSSTDQAIAERTLRGELRGLETSYEGGARRQALQGALVSLAPDSGRILAWVGGRDWQRGRFDHVAQARRQAGSAFKPFVYAAALEDHRLLPWELLSDEPLEVRFSRTVWRPRDSDGGSRGEVTPGDALAYSLNLPTVRVALRTGMPRVAAMAHTMGIVSPLSELPSLALGTAEVTPLEMAVAYSTLATTGRRPAPWGLEGALDDAGEALAGQAPEVPRRVLSGDTAFTVTGMLRGVLERGTGAAARDYGLRGELAGKTGTTDDRRDSWFAGYSAERTTVVWVGYDDNGATRLSGARAAVPLWSRFMAAVGPEEGYGPLPEPPGFVTVDVDPTSGLLATRSCPRSVRVTLPVSQAPLRSCDHGAPPPLLATGDGALAAAAPVQTLAEFIASSREASQHRTGEVLRLVGEGGHVELQRDSLQHAAGESPLPRVGLAGAFGSDPGTGRH